MTIYIEEETTKVKELMLSHQEIIERVIEAAIEYENCPYEAEIEVILTDNLSIQEINQQHRGIDSPTDVLSFPMIDYKIPSNFSHLEEEAQDYFNPETGELLLGDIVISVEKVMEQAEKYGHSTERELAFLVAHSMLHLFGYDHMEEAERKEMEKKQKEILNKLGIER